MPSDGYFVLVEKSATQIGGATVNNNFEVRIAYLKLTNFGVFFFRVERIGVKFLAHLSAEKIASRCDVFSLIF